MRRPIGWLCALIQNEPINQPLAPTPQPADRADDSAADWRSPITTIPSLRLSFSGGGTRAAAFSYGVLTGFDETQVPVYAPPIRCSTMSTSSPAYPGGSVLAAYYGLKKRAAMADFKQRFLLRNAEENLQMDLSLLNIAAGLQGGINDPTLFPRWLDDNLFDHATSNSLLSERRPRVWINASDIYNRTPFVFGRVLSARCAAILRVIRSRWRLAASAAVPVVFAPVVIKNYPGGCPLPLPDWVQRVRNDPTPRRCSSSTPTRLSAITTAKWLRKAARRRHRRQLRACAGFTIARLASDTPYGPLEPEKRVKLRRLLFLVVDAGRGALGRVGADRGGPVRRQPHHRRVRHRDRFRRCRQLFGV